MTYKIFLYSETKRFLMISQIFSKIILFLCFYSSSISISLLYSSKNTKMRLFLKIFQILSKIVLFRNIKNFYMSNLKLYLHQWCRNWIQSSAKNIKSSEGGSKEKKFDREIFFCIWQLITYLFFAEQQIWLTTASRLCIFSVFAFFEQVLAGENVFGHFTCIYLHI